MKEELDLNFKILTHTYENTGGGTMIGFDRVWIEDENRVIFVETNEMGCGFWHVDAYHWGLDDVEPFLAITAKYGDPRESVYCDIALKSMELFVKDGGASLPWCWLSDDIRAMIPEEYKKWVYENRFDRCFEIKKGCVVFDDGYELQPNRIAQATYHLPYVNLIGSLHNFMDSYLRLCADWEHANELALILDEKYPFHVSFDELAIPEWVNNSVFKIMENIIEKIENVE